MLGGVFSLLGVGVVVLVIALATGGQATGHGCVDVKVPGATGVTEIYRCGKAAKELCASASSAGSPSLSQAITAECRKGQIPVG